MCSSVISRMSIYSILKDCDNRIYFFVSEWSSSCFCTCFDQKLQRKVFRRAFRWFTTVCLLRPLRDSRFWQFSSFTIFFSSKCRKYLVGLHLSRLTYSPYCSHDMHSASHPAQHVCHNRWKCVWMYFVGVGVTSAQRWIFIPKLFIYKLHWKKV